MPSTPPQSAAAQPSMPDAGLPAAPSDITNTSQFTAPRWLLIVAWSTGPAAVYALLSLAHAALVERVLSVDVGFGRSLAFWIGTIYLALLGWGFLPARPAAWYARRRLVFALVALGWIGALVCGAFTGLWLAAHWVTSVGMPVTASAAIVLVVALGVLWLAGRDERDAAPPP